VTTNALPDQIIHLFKRVIPTGVAHGTVTVLYRRRKVEVTTFRGDLGYTDGRHPDQVVFLDSLKEDLKRRDFTVNAMAYDIKARRLIDPFGGQRDLKKKVIRAVGKPIERYNEDGLRALRAIRFASVLKFEIDQPTFSAIPEAIEVFRKVAPERIKDELLKILADVNAARGIELLRSSGLLAEVIPELLPTVGFEQNQFHRYDVYNHSIKSLEHARGDGVLKLAVLLHDIGKPNSAEGPQKLRTFYGHEKQSAKMVEKIMRRLKFSNAERNRACSLISNHMFHYEPGWTDGAVRRLVRRVDPKLLKNLWEIRRADAWGRGIGVRDSLANLRILRERVEKVMQADAALKITDLAISGNEVMKILGCKAGPLVGQALEALLERVLDEPELNSPNALKKILKTLSF
jgi:tRNA nucleotidyltransferase (CCA-adding enzyme)